jgi:DNA-binding transcriptional MerR regulator
MANDDAKKFNIQLAAQLSGLSAHTIRAWEKRYQALTPARTENGRRLYSEAEVDRLIMLSQLTHLGTNISQIARLPDAELRDTYHKLLQNTELVPAATLVRRDLAPEEVKAKLLDAVGAYKVDAISQLLGQAKTSFEPKTFALEILEPLIREVRSRCERTLFQDAQAQALFAIAKFHAGNIIYSHFERGLKSTNRIVLTSVEKEHHTFPLLISALLCCHYKKHFYYLNSNLPGPSIIDAVKATEANLLILSVPPRVHGDAELQSLLDEVINSLSPKVKVWLLGDFDHDAATAARWKNTRRIRSQQELDEVLGANP